MRTRIQNYNMYIYIYIFTLLIIAYTKSLARFINIFYLFYHFYVETLTDIVTCLPSYKHPLDIYLRNRTLPPCIQTRERALLWCKQLWAAINQSVTLRGVSEWCPNYNLNDWLSLPKRPKEERQPRALVSGDKTLGTRLKMKKICRVMESYLKPGFY